MTARNTRLVGLATAGALLTGLMAAPPVLAAGASSGDDPVFVRISSSDLPGGGDSAARAVRTARTAGTHLHAKVHQSKGVQILQSFAGRNNIGADSIGVATGPKDVLQVGANGGSVFTKSTGKVVKKYKSLNKLFGIDVSVGVSDPTVAYDPVGKRFVLVAVTDDGGDIGVAVRVSKTSDPTKWFASVRYMDTTATVIPDPNPDVDESTVRVGTSSNKVVVTAVADDPTDTTIANRIMFIPKQQLYKNTGPDAWVADVNNTYDGQAPAVNATKQANAFVAVPDTSDVTVTTYTGDATLKAPKFSKSVMYPTGTLLPPPLVDQGAADDLDLGPLTFNGVAWRSGKLYAAAATDCSGLACVKLFGVNTGNGVTLTSQKTLSSATDDWFSPSVAIDGAGNVHVVANDVAGAASGPNVVVIAKSGSTWTNALFLAKAAGEYNGPGNPTNWTGGTDAAIDPTSPWDVWVTGAIGTATNTLASKVARVSLAKNTAKIKADDTQVNKGEQVTFTAKLSRPGGDTIAGLPIALQK
ncbi:MAG TPA: hypothetical protein VMT88_07320, partial [Actinomycetes bacterium]|nr:hypothetical protein [Actinomycetes bacterium]